MTDRTFQAESKITVMEPTSENLLGFIQEEGIKQFTGVNQKDTLNLELPSKFSIARSLVNQTQPLVLRETVETLEPQPTFIAGG